MASNFFHFTQDWVNGELLEGIIVAAFGIAAVLIGVALWHYGKSPAARALVLPVIICGLAYTGIGLSLRISDRGLTEKFRAEYQANPKTFIVKEKQRVEDFQYMYKISKAVATVTFLATILIFWLTKTPTWHAWGIGLSIFGLAGLLVDYFSQHRALEYYNAILAVFNGWQLVYGLTTSSK